MKASIAERHGSMRKHDNLKPNSSGASARSDTSANSNSGSLPSSFEDWLHEDTPLISLEAWPEDPLPPFLGSDPATSGPDSDQANPSVN
jgi:hypothetical protein